MNMTDKIRKQIISGLQSAYCEMGESEFTDFCKELKTIINNYPKQKLQQPVVMQGCQCKDRIGETKVWCCNQCGLPCEDFWLPTHYTVGSRSVGKAGGDASVSDGK